jgi:hypothetical protein
VRTLFLGGALAGLLVSSGGCFIVDALDQYDTAAQARIDAVKQQLELDVDGQKVALPLDSLDAFWEDEESATGELYGEEIYLLVTFPAELAPTESGDWKKLLGKPIGVAPVETDDTDEVYYRVKVPGLEIERVLGGTLTIRDVQPAYDGQTPLRGDMELRVQTPQGEKTLKGALSVVGITYGE